MEGSSTSASSASTLTRRRGAGRSAHTSASWPGLPHRAHTAPSRPNGRPWRSPSLAFAEGMRAWKGCERCCARFAAVSSRWGCSLRRRPPEGGAAENAIATRGSTVSERDARIPNALGCRALDDATTRDRSVHPPATGEGSARPVQRSSPRVQGPPRGCAGRRARAIRRASASASRSRSPRRSSSRAEDARKKAVVDSSLRERSGDATRVSSLTMFDRYPRERLLARRRRRRLSPFRSRVRSVNSLRFPRHLSSSPPRPPRPPRLLPPRRVRRGAA